MYGGSLPVATRKRKSKKKYASEAAEEEEAFEPKPKKVKKEKGTLQEVGSAMPTIQEEVMDLEPVKVLNKRTRGGASFASSLPMSPQPIIHKKKRKHVVRKMKVSSYVTDEDVEVEGSTDIVTREVRKKKAADVDALQQTFEIATEILVPAEVLLNESTTEAAQKVVELAGDLQELVVAEQDLQEKDVACSGAGTSKVDASEATRGNSDSHNISENIVEVESTSTSTSSETLDDIPLSRVYENLHKALAPSPSSKHQKRPTDDVETSEPLPIEERVGALVDQRLGLCKNLHADHWFIPKFATPVQVIDLSETDQITSDNPEVTTSSSQTQPTTQSSDPSLLEELANHYKGELPGVKPNLEKASEMAPNTCSDLIIHPIFPTISS